MQLELWHVFAIVVISATVGGLTGLLLPGYIRYRARIRRARNHFKVRDLRK